MPAGLFFESLALIGRAAGGLSVPGFPRLSVLACCLLPVLLGGTGLTFGGTGETQIVALANRNRTLLGKYAPTGIKANGQATGAKKAPHAIGVEDFDLLKVIGKGSFGKVRSSRAREHRVEETKR